MTKKETSGKPDPRDLGDLGGLDRAQALRKQAEETVQGKAGQIPESLDALSPEASRELLHDLRVHQIELEMQNEELRRAREELEASRARYFDLYDLAPAGYLTMGETGMILEANLAVATMLGVARGALVKQPLSRFIFREDLDSYFQHRKLLLKAEAPQPCELRLARNDAPPCWARLEATAAQNDAGEPVYRVVVSDITERKNAEAEREQLLASEQEARAMAEKAIQLRDEFISIASHELKTPITSLQGFAQLLQRELARNGTMDPDLLSKAMDRIDQQAKRLSSLTDQLLNLSRLQAGKLALHRKQADLSEMIGMVIEDERHVHSGRAIELHRVGSDGLAFIDPLRIEQVLVNLIDNAIKFSPQDSKIDVSIDGSEPGWVKVAVRDRGAGIPKEEQERVFERYYQAHSGGYLTGMGIGLFISRQIVEMHGGTVTYEEPQGNGSLFVVRLPLVPSPDDPTA